MIARSINDAACLDQLTAVASDGAASPDIKTLAARFPDTVALALWIRGLPQRDDTGTADDGPRVMCDVGQRARLLADDPNCVERAILYLAAAEVIDPVPVRQLATVDISETVRHTFPVENGEPIVLDPQLRRNALRACVWKMRNGGDTEAPELDGVDAASLLGWLLDLAEDAAEDDAGERGVRRVARGRAALAHLFDGGQVSPRDRAHVLYALRLAGDVAPSFGAAGREGYRLARRLVARVVTYQTTGAPMPRNLNVEQGVYWGGKAVATFYGVGGLYDAAYNEVRRRPDAPQASVPTPRPTRVVVRPLPVVAIVADAPSRREATAAPAMVLGTLGELERKKGS